MSIHLFKHNEDAYRAVETMLEEKQMAAVIHPTGTGKSMIAFKLVEQHPHKHFLWLSPNEYIYKTQLENIHSHHSKYELCEHITACCKKSNGYTWWTGWLSYHNACNHICCSGNLYRIAGANFLLTGANRQKRKKV